MIKTVTFKGRSYPEFQAQGNASQFAIPFAKHVCEGIGYDIGCCKKEWAFPGAIAIDLEFDDAWDANNLPLEEVDYIYSSHCLEHVPDWVETLYYWRDKLKVGGTLFLYLPHYSQEYWRPWNNRKHLHVLTPECIGDMMKDIGFSNVFVGNRDLNDSFMVMGEKE